MAADTSQEERLRNLALSGGISGLVMGAGAAALGPFKKWSDLVRAAGIGGVGGASIASGGGYVGDELLGDPEEGESNPYTKRAGLGGATVGALGGGIAGSALGTGKISGLAQKVLPDNLITQALLKSASKGGLPRVGKLGALGALTGAGIGGFLAGDEGMQMDVIANERKDVLAAEQRRKLLEDLGYVAG